MNKVVLLKDRPEECETLISCLKILFPECEVQVQPKQAAELQRASLGIIKCIEKNCNFNRF